MTTPRPNPNPIYDTFAPTALRGRVVVLNAVADDTLAGPLAHELGRLGASVAFCSPNPAALQPVLHELLVVGRHALAIPCDGDHDEIGHAVDRVAQRWGRLDVLMNLATATFPGPAAGVSLAAWHEALDAVLHCSWYFCQAAARHMVPAGGGVIINVTTDEAQRSTAAAPAAAAKAAVGNLAKTLSAEWGPHHIRVNSVLLPAPDAPHPPTVQQVAWAAIFLATDAASYVTGECLDLTLG